MEGPEWGGGNGGGISGWKGGSQEEIRRWGSGAVTRLTIATTEDSIYWINSRFLSNELPGNE